MGKRKIIDIDRDKCDGCGLCIPNCPEGALQVIDGKACLISDLFCDGLGACIGHCPKDAIYIEEREARSYDERKVMANIVKHGPNVIKAHLEHLKEHGEDQYLKEANDYLKEMKIDIPGPDEQGGSHKVCGCPGSMAMDFTRKDKSVRREDHGAAKSSCLGQWPIQIMLVSPNAQYFKDADLLIAADCVPFAYADFHDKLLKGKILLVGCPKLDDMEYYKEKIGMIIKNNSVKSITYAHMEVPCCYGLVSIIRDLISKSGKDIPFKEVVIGIKGEMVK